MTDASIERETLTWDGFGSATRDLARSILESGFVPEVVVAIARGGLPVSYTHLTLPTNREV